MSSKKMIPFILTEDNMYNLIYQTFFNLFFASFEKSSSSVLPLFLYTQNFLRPVIFTKK
jgi:hypothetical protein